MRNLAKNHKCAYFCFEFPANKYVIDDDKILDVLLENGELSAKEKEAIDNNIYIIDEGLNVDDVVANILFLASMGVQFFVIDSQMRLNVEQARNTEEEESRKFEALTNLCNKYPITIFLIVQTSKNDTKSPLGSKKGGHEASIMIRIEHNKAKDSHSAFDETSRTVIIQKNKQTASFTNHANLWFNMNDFPRFKTYDDAIARRACLFRWNYVAKYAHFNQEYLPTIKKERGEFALKCLYYAKIAIERKPIKYSYISIPIQLTRSDSMIRDYKEWADTNDYFNSFIENECVIGKEYKIGTKFLLDKLNEFTKNNGGTGEYKMASFASRLQGKDVHKSSNPTSWRDEHGHFKTGVFVFQGITLKNIAKIEQEEQNFKLEQKKAGEQRWQAIING